MRSRLRFVVFGAVIVLLLISLAVNVYSFTLANVYYQQLNLLRLDPLGHGAYPSDAVESDRDEPVIVLFGDSRAEQWPAPGDLPDYTFVNRGIGAQTSAQAALRLDAHVRPLRPDVLVVQVCINDLKTLPLFPDHAAVIVENCLRYLESIVEQARAMDTTVILTTVFPVGEPPVQRWLVWSDGVAEAINRVNDFIRALASDDVLVLDTYALLADERGLVRAEFGVDELHLSAAGYALLNEHLSALLQTMRGINGAD